MKDLTDRQERVLTFIREFYALEGMPPTVREIADGLDFKSLNAVREHLRLIEKKGFVELRRNVARGICLVNTSTHTEATESIHDVPKFSRLPILGEVAAGTPITAVESMEGEIVVDSALFGEHDRFVFRVRGDSMIEAGIFDGDYVIVRRQQEARNGQIVVVFLDGDTTLKTYYNRNGNIILHPENQFLDDIVISAEQSFAIVGKMVGLIRKC